MPPIDPNKYRLPTSHAKTAQSIRRQVPRASKGEHFLRGPIPLNWLSAAARLPGKALHAGLAIWLEAGMRNSAVVPLSNVTGQRFGIDRNAKYRALQWLEGAGLITVERKLGRAPIVTINATPADQEA
jgi:hypothetical protein